jgi:anti-sigma-K factor RskA
MNAHQPYEEDLALYALGALQGDDRVAMEKHLDSCAECRRELEQLQGDMALLAWSAAGAKPPARSRERLMKSVSREPRRVGAPAHRSWRVLVPWFAVLILAGVAVLLGMRNNDFEKRLTRIQQDFAAKEAKVEEAREIVATLTAKDAQRVTLVAAKTPPQPQGKAIYVRERGRLIFIASDFPQLPPQRAYELWLIPKAGSPMAAGVFKPDAHGSAMIVHPPLPAGTEAKAFAITVEPDSGSSAPTSTPIMLGAGQ